MNGIKMSLLKTVVMEWLRSHPGGPNLIGLKSDLVIINDFEDNTDLKGIGGGLTELICVCSCGTENGQPIWKLISQFLIMVNIRPLHESSKYLLKKIKTYVCSKDTLC